MRASLLMYNPPELSGANQTFWAHIASNLRNAGLDAPKALSAEGFGSEFWTSEDLILSQICGLPYRVGLRDKVQLVGTPDYGVEGCPPGFYCSVILKHRGDDRSRLVDFAGARVAINGFESQSGFAALANEIAKTDIRFSDCIVTGSHLGSIRAVASGEADIAATDAVTMRLFERYEDVVTDLECIAHTRPTPGLPLVCSTAYCRRTVFDAVVGAIRAMPEADREALMLRGLVEIPDETYLSVPTPADRQDALLRSLEAGPDMVAKPGRH